MNELDRTNRRAVTDAFGHLEMGDLDAFFAYVHPRVEWIVMGSHLLAGTYHGRTTFREGPYVPINRDLENGASVRVRHQMVERDRAVVELETVPADYTVNTESHSYCWVLELDEGLITKVRAYVDAALIQEMMPV